ncbi:MAG: M20 family metallopeptidase [Candidatus Zixiibacteriota bacterium]
MEDTIPKTIKKIAHEIFPRLVKLRREFHQYPEIAFEEFETSKRITRELKQLKLQVKTGIAKTGVVGVLYGDKKGKTVALRADMDALPVTEQTDVPYKSRINGKMHACGHDMHMTCVIGAATVLSRMKNELPGNVKFIFQPSEESGSGGALPMIKAGVLKNPDVYGLFALHTDPSIPVGKMGVKDGPMMAHTNSFDLTITGKGGHGARPHQGVDAISVTAQVIQALQTIVSRRISPFDPVVVSIGVIQGGTASNIICDKVLLKGTVRTLDRKLNQRIPQMIRQIVSGITRSAGAGFSLDYKIGYPILKNDPEMTNLAREAISRLYSKKAIVEIKNPVMGGEDCAYFLSKVPGTFMRVGIRNTKKKAIYPWHHPKFNVDENAIKIGTSVLSQCVYDFLSGSR